MEGWWVQSWVWGTLAIVTTVIAVLLVIAIVTTSVQRASRTYPKTKSAVLKRPALKRLSGLIRRYCGFLGYALNRKLIKAVIANWAILTAILLVIFMTSKDAPIQLSKYKTIDFAHLSNVTDGMEKAIKNQKHDLRTFYFSDYGLMAEVASFSMRFANGECESLQFSIILTKDFLSYIKPFRLNGDGLLETSGKEKTYGAMEQTLTVKAQELKGFLAAMDGSDWMGLIRVGERGYLDINYCGNVDIASAAASENAFVIANGELAALGELDIDILGVDGALYPFFVVQTEVSSISIIFRS
jgi:hypothetical protein